jgi:hypothetical protein
LLDDGSGAHEIDGCGGASLTDFSYSGEVAELPVSDAEEAAAARRLSMIEAGRRKGGVLGAAAAGAMIGIRDVYEGPPKDDDIVIVSEAPGDPEDIDIDGITGRVSDVDFWAPPPHDPRS